jgi:hypothetical protein
MGDRKILPPVAFAPADLVSRDQTLLQPEHAGGSSVQVLESWRIFDRWWTETPFEREYCVVSWDGREITFCRDAPDRTWRVYRSGK